MKTLGRRTIGAALLALLAATGGCKENSGSESERRAPSSALEEARPQRALAPAEPASSAKPVLSQVRIETVAPEAPRPLFSDVLGKRLGATLTASGVFAAESSAEEGPQGPRCEVLAKLTYDVIEAKEGAPGSVYVALEAKVLFLDLPSAPEATSRLIVERSLDGKATERGNVLLDETSSRAFEELAKALIRMERLRQSTDAELLSALSRELRDAELRAWALRLAGERKLAEAVDPAIEALGDADKQVAREAVSALVAIGERRAVGALTERVDFQDYDQVRVTIEALSVLGGDEARSFLEFVATGHPSSEIQSRAREALRRTPADP